MKRLNYKNFKKVHEDANSATLQHPEGHTIKIAKGPLSDHIKKQLGALPFADGGEVEVKDAPGEGSEKAREVINGSKALPPTSAEQERTHQQVHKYSPYSHSLSLPAGMAEGGEVDHPMSLPPEQEPDITSQLANMQIPPSGPQNPQIPKAVPQNQDMQNALSRNYPEEAMGQAQAGTENQLQAEGQLGKQEADINKQNTSELFDLKTKTNGLVNHYMQEATKVANEANSQKISADHFWADKGVLGKVSTAIGLILGGMGSGVTGGPNPALQFLNQQIDRDMEAQRMQQGQKMNMLTALQHQFGNQMDAMNMGKVFQAAAYTSKLNEAAAKSKDPMALARAQQASAQILAQYGPLVQQTAMRQAVLSGTSQGQVAPERAVPFLVPEAEQKEAFKEIGTQQEVESMRNNALQSFDHISSKIANGTFSPNDTNSAKQAFIGKLIKVTEGRYNYEAAQNLADAIFPQKTDIGKETNNNKRMRLNELMDSLSQTPTLNAYGIKIPKPAASKFHK